MGIYVIQTTAYIDTPAATARELNRALESYLAGRLQHQLEQRGVKPLRIESETRHARREEAMAVTPRRTHMESSRGTALCKSPVFVLTRILRDESRVTCKKCLRLLNQRHLVEEGRD